MLNMKCLPSDYCSTFTLTLTGVTGALEHWSKLKQKPKTTAL